MSKSRLETIRAKWNKDTISEDEIFIIFAEIDRLATANEQLGKNVRHWMEETFKENKAKIEARAQQAHTASCNLELMRKLDRCEVAVRFYADAKNWEEETLSNGLTITGPACDEGAAARKALGENKD